MTLQTSHLSTRDKAEPGHAGRLTAHVAAGGPWPVSRPPRRPLSLPGPGSARVCLAPRGCLSAASSPAGTSLPWASISVLGEASAYFMPE